MIVTLTENQLKRCFLKGVPAFLVVLLIGLVPYIAIIRHQFEEIRYAKYESRIEILVGSLGKNKPAFEPSLLEEALREKIPGNVTVRIFDPNKPNRIEVIADLPSNELISILQSYGEDETRTVQRVKGQLEAEIELRFTMLNKAREEIEKLVWSPVITGEVRPEAIMTVSYLVDELVELGEELENVEPSKIDSASQEGSGRILWNFWRTTSAIIGSLGIFYFAAISGLAFGYIRDRRK